ncbi:MAG: aconitase X swivel domain-containing protein [Arenicellales bacterium WSBS_2016_MAG_OTU3]
MRNLACKPLLPGTAKAQALVLDQPISFWGGVSVADGSITNDRHPQFKQTVTGKVLMMENTIGSSSSSAIILELIRTGKAPAAIVLKTPDAVLCLGVIVAAEMGYQTLPVVQLEDDFPMSGESIEIHSDGVTASITVV